MPEISLSLTFLNDNNLLASSFEDNTIRFANINEASLNSITFNNSKILRGHKHFIKVITALNKTILASGSCDNTIILWDILTFTQVNNCLNLKQILRMTEQDRNETVRLYKQNL